MTDQPERDPLRQLHDLMQTQASPLIWPELEEIIAAWEKERAEAGYRETLELGTALRRLDALRAAVERIEGEIRGARCICKFGGETADCDDQLQEFADALRAAREPNRPQEERDAEADSSRNS